MVGPAPGKHADEEAEHGAADDRPAAARPVGGGEHDVAEPVARVQNALVGRGLGAHQHLAEPEEPDGDGQEVHPVEHLGDPEGEARIARDDVEAGHGQHEPEHHADVGLQRVLPGESRHRGEAEEHEGEGFGRAEGQRPPGQERRQRHEQHDAEGAGHERADGGHAERGARASLERHLVAVDAGDHRGRFARRVDQHGGDGAAVHRARVERRQHDDARHGAHPEGERQQEGHARDRSHAGQRADQRAEGDARDGHHEIERREGDREAHREVAEEVHQSPKMPAGNGTRSQ